MPGITYWYGITVIDAEGRESLISWLVNATPTGGGRAQSREEAVARASTWLEAAQQANGFWSNKRHLKILSTIHALDLFQRQGIDSAGIRRGHYALRGAPALNNDFLARRITTLSTQGQNVDADLARLIVNAYRTGDQLNGWGVQKNYFPDAVDTVLGARAIEDSQMPLSLPNECYKTLRDWYSPLEPDYDIRSTEADKFAWVNGGAPSIYVSAMAYAALDGHYRDEAPLIDYQWMLDAQRPDGSLNGSLVDTAGVLLWLDIPESVRAAAVAYLVSRQAADGSWDSDPFLTGLCAKALAAGHPFGHEKYAFDGSQYAFSIFDEGWDFGGSDFTLTMKVKLVDDGRRYHGIATKDQSWKLHYDRLHNILAFNSVDGSVSLTTDPLENILFDGSHHTVQISRSATTWRIWVDGTLQCHHTGAAVMPNDEGRRYIGRAIVDGSTWSCMAGEVEIISP